MVRVCALILVCFGALAQEAKPPVPAAPATPAAPAAPAGPATLVGSEVCLTCHEDLAKTFTANPHHAVETDAKHGFQGHACESCHGPGSNHEGSASAADIRNPSKLSAAEADHMCLSCHLNQATHAGRIESSHARNEVACTSCHKIHANGPMGLVARKPAAVNELCSSCHISVRAKFNEPFTHKLAQGAMTCVDCHNPHGNFRPGMLQTVSANEPACAKCHTDTRGPFTFEHAPVRFEGCGSCHVAHGSTNPRMLIRQEVRLVCLECHANLPSQGSATNVAGVMGVVPPAFHDLRSPRYQNCSMCHQKIHGSYVDRNLLR